MLWISLDFPIMHMFGTYLTQMQLLVGLVHDCLMVPNTFPSGTLTDGSCETKTINKATL